VCLVAAVGLGVSNPYNLLFWLQLMGWAVVVQWCTGRRRTNLLIGLAAGALAVGLFLASNIELWLYVQEPDGVPLLVRNYGGTEIYALKPMEMFVPPTFHRWSELAFLGDRYVRWSPWRGEVFLPYLGIFGVLAFAWLATVTVRRIIGRRGLPGQALSAGWLIAYASVGGITNLLALMVGFQVFRATNRVAVFISALVLVFLVVRLSRLTCRWPAWRRLAAAVAVAAIGVLDQVPKAASAAEQAELAERVHSDERLGRELEAALPRGAMVFQLPVVGFPEATTPGRLADYELFRPYLVTETLRFSYGAAKFRARSRWQRDLENVPAATLVRRLEAFGFAALYLNRKGYEDRAEKLLRELTALGYTRRLEGARGQQVAVLLNPRPDPLLPLGRMLTFGNGWHPRQPNGVRWANDDAVLSFFNPYAEPLTARLRLELVAPTERELTVLHNGRPWKSLRAGGNPAVLEDAALVLAPGVNVWTIKSAGPAVRLGAGRYSLRKFGLRESAISITSPGKTVK
jgi:hypothetical protein